MDYKPLWLIADDDPDDQFLIQHIVDEACTPELETHYLRDGVELMDFLTDEAEKSRQPNLVMIDLNMPRKDGRTALREIKADPRLAAIPVVVLTTSRSEDDVRYCKRLGVSHYFRKPSTLSEYRDIISGLCQVYI